MTWQLSVPAQPGKRPRSRAPSLASEWRVSIAPPALAASAFTTAPFRANLCVKRFCTFTGFYHRQTYGARHYKDLTMRELMDRCAQVESNETQIVLDQLERNRVDFIEGEASFDNEHTLVARNAEHNTAITKSRLLQVSRQSVAAD